MPGLYLHIPFCERKCVYCSFYSVETSDSVERFMRAIVREIGMMADRLDNDPDAPAEYTTVFFGGGTPSLLSPEDLSRILDPLRRRFRIAPDAEITMECNPGAFTNEWLEGYRDLGVNRLSFGVQSFHDDELAFLTRIHSAAAARASIAQARRTFENVSLDLIFALPGQTIDRWRHNLREAVALDTAHVSAYSLIFESGTPLNAMRLRGEVEPSPDDLDAEMYEITVEELGSHGFAQYEVSNYARPGRECKHNVGYWERDTYVSFGPSAHSLLRRPGGDVRWANVPNLGSWLARVEEGVLPVSTTEHVSAGTALDELVMLGLRSSGISLREFRRLTGDDLVRRAPSTVGTMIEKGYAEMREDRLALTSAGYIFADRFALEIISECAA